jgi:hypothetical protein
MTLIIDTSVWLALFRDTTGTIATRLKSAVGQERVVMAPPIRLELLQGCRGEAEWNRMQARLSAFDTLAMLPEIWDNAARAYFDLRQAGITPRSSLDCCIALIAVHHGCNLLHADRDFEAIAKVCALNQRQFEIA